MSREERLDEIFKHFGTEYLAKYIYNACFLNNANSVYVRVVQQHIKSIEYN